MSQGESTLALEFQSVRRLYDGNATIAALDDVSLQLPRGSFAALIGPSGSGKTTFLNLASGLDHPTSGEISIGGRKMSGMSDKELCLFRRRHIGFVFQSYNLFPVLTAIENIEFTSLIRGDNARDARARAKDALESVGLSDRAGSYPNQLSGGQQQRVAIARALATEPDIIFADEPTANLDSKTADHLIEMFSTINQESGVTFLFSTHDHSLIDRVRTKIHLKDGRLNGIA
jgi:putative ABC transport system ATP-binding protein